MDIARRLERCRTKGTVLYHINYDSRVEAQVSRDIPNRGGKRFRPGFSSLASARQSWIEQKGGSLSSL